MELGIIIFLLFIGYTFGSIREKKHYKSLEVRELKFNHIPVVTGKKFVNTTEEIASSKLATGTVVIAQDYFKSMVSGLKNIFGGNIHVYETLLDRGRREALLRLIESAPKSDIFVNLRFETSQITMGSIEVFAYATAIKYK